MFDSPIIRPSARDITASDVTGTDDDGDTRKVEYSAYHDKDRKRFTLTLRRVSVENSDGPFSIVKYSPMDDMLRVGSVPVARYSEKALRAAWDSGLAVARDAVANGWK